MKTKRNLFSTLAAVGMMLGLGTSAAATVYYYSGGVFESDFYNGRVYSYYYHDGSKHKSIAIGTYRKDSEWVTPGYTSGASAPQAMWGNKTYYDIK